MTKQKKVFYNIDTISINAGAMMLNVDILTAPNNDTNRSNQGTVAARATEK